MSMSSFQSEEKKNWETTSPDMVCLIIWSLLRQQEKFGGFFSTIGLILNINKTHNNFYSAFGK